jgi:peptidoglycan/LPS O-acetylase OafA/YrhL
MTPSDEPGLVSPATELKLATSAKRIPELDGLRGLAILLVVLCHYVAGSDLTLLSAVPRRFFRLFAVGWSGVDLFFVLSGFLIGGILLESRQSPRYFQTFYLRRVHRILPIYYSWIFLYVLFLGVFFLFVPTELNGAANLRHLPYYIGFLQNYLLDKPYLEVIWLGVTWSLAVEEQFYLCAPLMIRHLSTRKLLMVLTGVILIALLLRLVICVFFPVYYHLVTFATPCRADALAWGMLAAVAFQYPKVRGYLRDHSSVLSRGLLVLSLGFMTLTYWMVRPAGTIVGTVGLSFLAVFYLCLLLFILCTPGSWLARVMRSKSLRNLGMISYCVYIIHLPINLAVHRLLLHSSPRFYDLKGMVVTAFSAILTWSLAMVSWHFLEKPLVRRGHRYSY